MPSRLVTFLIVGFWLSTLGWFGYREVRPRLHAGDVPPFVIELDDELTSQLPNDPTRTADIIWIVYRDDKEIGRAQTRLRYLKNENAFELQSRVVELKLMKNIVEIPEMINTYTLTREGELLAMETTGKVRMLNAFTGEANFRGVIQDGKLIRTGTILLPAGFGTVAPQLETIDAPKGSFLNPLHPVPRVKGLRPGRQWRMQVVNPLGDTVGPAMQAIQERLTPGKQGLKLSLPTGPKFLNAEVLTETAKVRYNGKDHECRIIEYRSENETYRTFVRVGDGWVLRQESQALGERIVMQRP